MANLTPATDSIRSFIIFAFWMIGFFGFLIIAVIKRRRQMGRRWKRRLAARVKINDIQLTCRHCNEDYFYKREALIGSTLATFFGYHYFNQSGAAYTCTKCGHVHWFSKPKETSVEFFRDRE